MNTKFFTKLFTILILIINLFNTEFSHSQTFGNFGIKAGLNITGLHTFNKYEMWSATSANTFISDSSAFFNTLSFEIGIFAELFNSEKFCIHTELHYIMRGEPDTSEYIVPNHYMVPQPYEWYWETGYLYDKQYYLSFQILPRYRIVVTPSKRDNIYLLGGLTFDFLIKNKSRYTKPAYIDKSTFINNISGIFGFGFEWERTLSFELRFEHNLTGPYNFKYKDDKIARRYTTISFLGGIALNRLMK